MLMDSFDKKYIEDMFEEGLKGDVFNGNKRNLYYKYEYNGFIYTLNRVPKEDNLVPQQLINPYNIENIKYRGNM